MVTDFFRGLALLVLTVVASAASAAEVVLDLPEPLVPGVQTTGILTVKDPPAQIAKIELPAIPGLEWQVSGNRGNRMTIVNGVQSSEVSFSLTLRAAQAGTLAITPVKIRLRDGQVLASEPRSLKVEAGDGNLVGDAKADLHFEPARIVPGEATSLIYRIHIRRGFDVKTLGIAPPDGAITLGERTIAQGRTVDALGQEWTLVTVTWPLTHANPGSYTVRGQQEYLAPVNDGFFVQYDRRQLAVPAAVLTVDPLPAQGRPEGFTGLIGPLTAVASLDRERVSAGEGAVVRIAVTGRQTDLVKRPELAIANVQVYPKDDATKDGTRTFRYDLVPAVPGTVTIPAVHIPFFDPGSRSYRTADTAALTLAVIPGRTRDLGIVGATPATTTPTAAAPAAPTLPAPLHGAVGHRPPATWAPLAFVGGVVLSLALTLLARIPRRAGPHRGKALAKAGRDPARLAAALLALRPALTTPEQRVAADALEAAIDRARFGGEPLADPTAWIAALEGIP